ncbi:hypothetical protein GHT06_013849 [Daphnia sinensis]|uniref:Alpha 1,4-glycosyltransferase domain-containing protein n=1 Tax=Daphnia sinensis TaxID=1820382 RepID=A0AAD5KST5_9CRUS|nr:hypothetical protein GHT06_013849 [Daphnia sinensis]
MKSEDTLTGSPNPFRFCNFWKEIRCNGVINIKNRRAYLLVFSCTGLLTFAYLALYSNANYLTSWPTSFSFGANDSYTESPAEFRREFETIKGFLPDGANAFFLETAGNETLNIRQACAVESLALHNPSVTAYVLFGQESVHSSSVTLRTLTENYKNIRVVGLNMDNYLAGSPLEHWYKFTDWRNGPYHVAHFSDGLRLLTLSRYGGYYFDLDIIHVYPIRCSMIYCNILYFIWNSKFFVGVCGRADAWTHNGPDLLGRILTKCVLPKTSFYPVHYGNWQEFFRQRETNDTMKPDWLTTEVIGIHIWNKLSYGEPVFRNSTQYYTQLARIHCPATFSIAPNVF